MCRYKILLTIVPKVRRFNFFDWNKRETDELYKGPLGKKNDSLPAMGKNPDVTIRNERGHGKMYLLCSKNSKKLKSKQK